MPNQNLTPADTFDTCFEWLVQNLTKHINASCDQIPKDLKNKGIYFWFMHRDGYDALSTFVTIKPIDPLYHKEIDGVKFDLVYLGTAGTGKKGNSNLRERMHWHLCTHHTESAICSGTLSTLRAGLGSLLSDDLILPNTEATVYDFMNKYMKVYWVEYGEDDKKLIDADEVILIDRLKPLLNIKNNPNAKFDNTPTKKYQSRRIAVYEHTWRRLKCHDEDIITQENNSSPEINPPEYTHQILSDKDCIKFTVSNNESIAGVIMGINNLPKGPCKVICNDSNYPHQIVYTMANGNGWRSTGNGGQNIYTYFANVDTNMDNKYRWLIIQNEMIQKGIKEITVTVCDR